MKVEITYDRLKELERAEAKLNATKAIGIDECKHNELVRTRYTSYKKVMYEGLEWDADDNRDYLYLN